MGAWGCGAFENDDAADWIADLEAAEGNEAIEDAFDAVDEVDAEDDYLEADVAAVALAAAEVVAVLRGKPAKELPEEVADWAAPREAPSAAPVRRARKIVERVRDQSELKELWAESEESDTWVSEVNDLLTRLS